MFQSLDIGCGFIKNKHKIKGNIGVDVRRGICNIQCDAQHLPFRENVFIFVNMVAVLEHLDKPLLALKEAKRVSKNNASFYIVIPVDARGNLIKFKQLIFEFPLSLLKIVKFYCSIPKYHPIGHKRQIYLKDISKEIKIVDVKLNAPHSWFKLFKKVFSFNPQIGMWKDYEIWGVKR